MRGSRARRRGGFGSVTANLVIGAAGQVAQHCLAALRDAVGVTRHQLDVTDADAFAQVMADVKPRVVWFTAAVANVDFCEMHPDVARRTNVDAIATAVALCNQHGAKLVFLSSEYLFDGVAGPYREDEPANPLSKYAVQKLIAEHTIASFANDWLIVRTAGVFSWETQRKNFVCRLIDTLGAGKPLIVPADQWSTPTYAPDLVRAMIDLVARGERGVFNVAGPRFLSRYDFALAAARAFDLDAALIKPVSTAELKQPAPRPLKAGLISDKAERVLGRPFVDFETAFGLMHALR